MSLIAMCWLRSFRGNGLFFVHWFVLVMDCRWKITPVAGWLPGSFIDRISPGQSIYNEWRHDGASNFWDPPMQTPRLISNLKKKERGKMNEFVSSRKLLDGSAMKDDTSGKRVIEFFFFLSYLLHLFVRLFLLVVNRFVCFLSVSHSFSFSPHLTFFCCSKNKEKTVVKNRFGITFWIKTK